MLKSQLPIALCSARRDRLICETLDYGILFRSFLDMSLQERAFSVSTFGRNRERLAREKASLQFVDAVLREARRRKPLSDVQFGSSEPSTSADLPNANLQIPWYGKAAGVTPPLHDALMDGRPE